LIFKNRKKRKKLKIYNKCLRDLFLSPVDEYSTSENHSCLLSKMGYAQEMKNGWAFRRGTQRSTRRNTPEKSFTLQLKLKIILRTLTHPDIFYLKCFYQPKTEPSGDEINTKEIEELERSIKYKEKIW